MSGNATRSGPTGDYMRRFLRDAAHLASGRGVSVLLGILALAMTARLLGPALLGTLALIEGYARLVDQVVRLESWQAIVRYGAETRDAPAPARLARLLKLGVLCDIAGATLAVGVGLAALPLAARLLHLDPHATRLAAIYCIVLWFGISSTPVGILRLHGRFAAIAWIDPAIALVRVVAVAAIWASGGGLDAVFTLALLLVVSERVAMSLLAARLLGRAGVAALARAPLRGSLALFPGIARFVLLANATVLVRKITQEIDSLAVGHFAGSEATGIYQLARRLMLTAGKVGQMLQQVAFPDLARLWTRDEIGTFHAVVGRIERATAGFGALLPVAVVLFGHAAIVAIGGPRFAGAYWPLLVYAIATWLFLSGSAIRSALMVAGEQATVLRRSLLAAAVYALALPIAVERLGATGAAAAQAVFNALALILILPPYRRLARRPRSPQAPAHRPSAAPRG